MDNKLLNILSIHARNTLLDKIMQKNTKCNDLGQVYILYAAIILGANSLAGFLNILLALALGLICGEGLFKHAFERRRPLIAESKYTLLVKLPDSFSFPSGHTISSFAFLGVTWYMDLQFKYLIIGISYFNFIFKGISACALSIRHHRQYRAWIYLRHDFN